MQLKKIRQEALSGFSKVKSAEDLDALRVSFLGKKGLISEVLKDLKLLKPEKRKKAGQEANQLKSEIEAWVEEAKLRLGTLNKIKILEKRLDVTLPGKKMPLGALHPITQTAYDFLDILGDLGFESVRGPEIEHDFYNFEALNIPADH